MAKAKTVSKSSTVTIITPERKAGVDGWMEREGVEAKDGAVVLFKRVSKDFKTQEGTTRETEWKVGDSLEHPNWRPNSEECGAGKFHACSRPYLCDEFRDQAEDRYVAIEIQTSDLHAWDDSPQYPHKIAFRAGNVLFECDKLGKKK